MSGGEFSIFNRVTVSRQHIERLERERDEARARLREVEAELRDALMRAIDEDGQP